MFLENDSLIEIIENWNTLIFKSVNFTDLGQVSKSNSMYIFIL